MQSHGEFKYDFPLDLETDNVIATMVERIDPNSIVLEFGPAHGRMTRYLTEELNCSVYIVEIDKDAYKSVRNIAKDGICGNIEDYEWVDKFQNIKFDYIIWADVLEHLLDPESALKSSIELLKDDGDCLISVPNISYCGVVYSLLEDKFEYSEVGIIDSTHVKFFTYNSLINLFNSCDLEIAFEKAFVNDIGYSEFSSYSHEIPFEIREYVEMKDFTNVYEYVFSVKKVKVSIVQAETDEELPPRLLSVDETRLMTSLYIDLGDGFNETHVQKKDVSITNGIVDITYNLSQYDTIKALRWDPTEGNACICKIDYIHCDGKAAEFKPYNAIKDSQNRDVFCTDDPIYFISSDSNRLNEIRIRGSVEIVPMILAYAEAIPSLLMNNERMNHIDAELGALHLKLEAQHHEYIKLEQVNVGKENEISKLKVELNESICESKKLLYKITDLDDIIIQLKSEINNRNEEILKTRVEFDEIRSSIQNDNYHLLEALKESEIKYTKKMADYDNVALEISKLEKHNAELIALNESTNIQVKGLEKECTELKSTWSWKVTKPFRSIYHFFKG